MEPKPSGEANLQKTWDKIAGVVTALAQGEGNGQAVSMKLASMHAGPLRHFPTANPTALTSPPMGIMEVAVVRCRRHALTVTLLIGV